LMDQSKVLDGVFIRYVFDTGAHITPEANWK